MLYNMESWINKFTNKYIVFPTYFMSGARSKGQLLNGRVVGNKLKTTRVSFIAYFDTSIPNFFFLVGLSAEC